MTSYKQFFPRKLLRARSYLWTHRTCSKSYPAGLPWFILTTAAALYDYTWLGAICRRDTAIMASRLPNSCISTMLKPAISSALYKEKVKLTSLSGGPRLIDACYHSPALTLYRKRWNLYSIRLWPFPSGSREQILASACQHPTLCRVWRLHGAWHA